MTADGPGANELTKLTVDCQNSSALDGDETPIKARIVATAALREMTMMASSKSLSIEADGLPGVKKRAWPMLNAAVGAQYGLRRETADDLIARAFSPVRQTLTHPRRILKTTPRRGVFRMTG